MGYGFCLLRDSFLPETEELLDDKGEQHLVVALPPSTKCPPAGVTNMPPAQIGRDANSIEKSPAAGKMKQLSAAYL